MSLFFIFSFTGFFWGAPQLFADPSHSSCQNGFLKNAAQTPDSLKLHWKNHLERSSKPPGSALMKETLLALQEWDFTQVVAFLSPEFKERAASLLDSDFYTQITTGNHAQLLQSPIFTQPLTAVTFWKKLGTLIQSMEFIARLDLLLVNDPAWKEIRSRMQKSVKNPSSSIAIEADLQMITQSLRAETYPSQSLLRRTLNSLLKASFELLDPDSLTGLLIEMEATLFTIEELKAAGTLERYSPAGSSALSIEGTWASVQSQISDRRNHISDLMAAWDSPKIVALESDNHSGYRIDEWSAIASDLSWFRFLIDTATFIQETFNHFPNSIRTLQTHLLEVLGEDGDDFSEILQRNREKKQDRFLVSLKRAIESDHIESVERLLGLRMMRAETLIFDGHSLRDFATSSEMLIVLDLFEIR